MRELISAALQGIGVAGLVGGLLYLAYRITDDSDPDGMA